MTPSRGERRARSVTRRKIIRQQRLLLTLSFSLARIQSQKRREKFRSAAKHPNDFLSFFTHAYAEYEKKSENFSGLPGLFLLACPGLRACLTDNDHAENLSLSLSNAALRIALTVPAAATEEKKKLPMERPTSE